MNETASKKDFDEWLLSAGKPCFISSNSGKQQISVLFSGLHVPLNLKSRRDLQTTMRSIASNKSSNSDTDFSTLFTLLFVLLSGDINPNPGPIQSVRQRKPKHPCIHCGIGVVSRSRAISCDSCENWVHSRCTGFLQACCR